MKRKPTVIWRTVMLAVFTAILCGEVETGDLFLDKLAGIVRSFIYIGLFTGWGFYLRRRIIHKQALFYLELIAGCMVFWLLMRTLKYCVLSDITPMRWCWYLYYIPFILIPELSLSTARVFGKVEEGKTEKKDKFFRGIAIALIGLVLTNDFHQMIFTFPEGAPFSDRNYSYGALFPLIILWIGGCMLFSVLILIYRCRIPGRKMLWFPLVPVGCIFLWCILNIIRAPLLKVFASDMTAFVCLFTAITFECCVQCGLIQTNVRYPELFALCSGISMELVDRENKVRYVSGTGFPELPEEMFPVSGESVYLRDGNKLNSMPVNGGCLYWTENVTRLRQLEQNLLEVREELSGRNQLLQAEYKKESVRKRTEEKNRLYDLMQFQTADQMKKISSCMESLKEKKNPEEYKNILEKLIVTGTYLKRRNNLILVENEKGRVPEMELRLALQEFCSSLPSDKIHGHFYIHTENGWLPLRAAVRTLDILEHMTDCYEKELRWFFVRVIQTEEKNRITITVKGPENPGQLMKKYPDIYTEQEGEEEWFLRLQ